MRVPFILSIAVAMLAANQAHARGHKHAKQNATEEHASTDEREDAKDAKDTKEKAAGPDAEENAADDADDDAANDDEKKDAGADDEEDAGDARATARSRRHARKEREVAEAKYREEAVGFGDGFAFSSDGRSSHAYSFQYAYQGELKRPLETPEFFRIVGRDDLAESFNHRHHIKIGLLVGGAAATIGGLALSVVYADHRFLGQESCFSFPSDAAADAACNARNEQRIASAQPYLYTSIGLMGAGLLATFAIYTFSTSPVPTRTYYDLAANYNAKLRRKYGLPTASTASATMPAVRDVVVSPYASSGGGGFAVSGRF